MESTAQGISRSSALLVTREATSRGEQETSFGRIRLGTGGYAGEAGENERLKIMSNSFHPIFCALVDCLDCRSDFGASLVLM